MYIKGVPKLLSPTFHVGNSAQFDAITNSFKQKLAV